MSLSALAIRTCAFMALYRQTTAGDRVHESALTSIDDLMQTTAAPFITIVTDEASSGSGGDSDISLMAPFRRLILVIEAAIGQAVSVPGDDGSEDGVTVVIPATEPGLEWSLDILCHQIIRRLASDATWGDLFRRFTLSTNDVTVVRGGMSQDGVRAASHQIIIDLHPVGEPDANALADDDGAASPWADFIAALRAVPVGGSADPELAVYRDLASAVEAAIKYPAGLVPWEIQAARLGLARTEASAAGFGPVIPVETQETPELDVIELEGTEIDADFAEQVDGPDPD